MLGLKQSENHFKNSIEKEHENLVDAPQEESIHKKLNKSIE